jgi:hypothetical protein
MGFSFRLVVDQLKIDRVCGREIHLYEILSKEEVYERVLGRFSGKISGHSLNHTGLYKGASSSTFVQPCVVK